MGEAKLRADDIDAARAQREAEVAQVQQIAQFTAEAATFVNGMFASVGDGVIRVTFHEASHPALPPRARASLVMTPGVTEQIANTLLKIVAAFREQSAGQAVPPADAPDESTVN